MKGHITLVGCPKLDSVDYSEKLTEIIRNNDIKSVVIVRMEVPLLRRIGARRENSPAKQREIHSVAGRNSFHGWKYTGLKLQFRAGSVPPMPDGRRCGPRAAFSLAVFDSFRCAPLRLTCKAEKSCLNMKLPCKRNTSGMCSFFVLYDFVTPYFSCPWRGTAAHHRPGAHIPRANSPSAVMGLPAAGQGQQDQYTRQNQQCAQDYIQNTQAAWQSRLPLLVHPEG